MERNYWRKYPGDRKYRRLAGYLPFAGLNLFFWSWRQSVISNIHGFYRHYWSNCQVTLPRLISKILKNIHYCSSSCSIYGQSRCPGDFPIPRCWSDLLKPWVWEKWPHGDFDLFGAIPYFCAIEHGWRGSKKTGRCMLKAMQLMQMSQAQRVAEEKPLVTICCTFLPKCNG